MCSQNGYCDPDESVCVCDFGYAGTYCDECDKGFVYDVTTGLCTSCPAGSTGQYVCNMCRDGYTVNQWQECVKCPKLSEAIGTFVAAVAIPIAALVLFVWTVNTKLLALCSKAHFPVTLSLFPTVCFVEPLLVFCSDLVSNVTNYDVAGYRVIHVTQSLLLTVSERRRCRGSPCRRRCDDEAVGRAELCSGILHARFLATTARLELPG